VIKYNLLQSLSPTESKYNHPKSTPAIEKIYAAIAACHTQSFPAIMAYALIARKSPHSPSTIAAGIIFGSSRTAERMGICTPEWSEAATRKVNASKRNYNENDISNHCFIKRINHCLLSFKLEYNFRHISWSLKLKVCY
jgi:hypothetical protein